MSDFKATLSDKMIERLAPAGKGEQYVVTDTELRGFFLKVGVNKKTFMGARGVLAGRPALHQEGGHRDDR
jgi:hypothetical protein